LAYPIFTLGYGKSLPSDGSDLPIMTPFLANHAGLKFPISNFFLAIQIGFELPFFGSILVIQNYR
jgi:hypothetical protein